MEFKEACLNKLKITICESKTQEFIVTLYEGTDLQYAFYASADGLAYLRGLIDRRLPPLSNSCGDCPLGARLPRNQD